MKMRSYIFMLSLGALLLPYYSAHAKEVNRRMGDANYGTHMAALATAVINTDGAVLEMGGSDFSTPLLHVLCSVKKRFLLTADTNDSWLNLFRDLSTYWHHFQHVPAYRNCRSSDLMIGGNPEAWDQVKNDRHWSVVFIDHSPGIRRPIDIERLRNNADVFVVHDQVKTMVVSDIIDVARWFKD
jgi:hypothetical protein